MYEECLARMRRRGTSIAAELRSLAMLGLAVSKEDQREYNGPRPGRSE